MHKSFSFSCFPFVRGEAGQILVIFHPILLFRPILLLNFGRFSILYYYYILVIFHPILLFRPILLLNFGRFPPYTIIPTYTTIWNVRVPIFLHFLRYFSYFPCPSNSFIPYLFLFVSPNIHINILISLTSNFFPCSFFTAHKSGIICFSFPFCMDFDWLSDFCPDYWIPCVGNP